MYDRLETDFTEIADKSKKKAEGDQYEPVSLSKVVSTMVVCQVVNKSSSHRLNTANICAILTPVSPTAEACLGDPGSAW